MDQGAHTRSAKANRVRRTRVRTARRDSLPRLPGFAWSVLLAGSAMLLLLQALTGIHGVVALGLFAALTVAWTQIDRVIRLLSRNRTQKPRNRVAVIGEAGVGNKPVVFPLKAVQDRLRPSRPLAR